MAAAPVVFTPNQINAGSIVKDAVFTVSIFNAGASPVTVSSITLTNIDNTLLSYTPGTIGVGATYNFTVTIQAAGQPVFPNAYLAIVFSGFDTVNYRITGYRFSFVDLKHNWAAPVKERLEWLTDVLQTRDGHEFRRSLRRFPRSFLTLSHITRTDRERVNWEGTFYAAQSQQFGVIAWHDIARTSADINPGGSVASFVPHLTTLPFHFCAGFDYVIGQYVGFFFEKDPGKGASWYIHTVADFNGQGLQFSPATDVKIPKGTIMAPVRTGAAPPSFSAKRLTTRHTQFDIEYRCPYDVTEVYGAGTFYGISRYTEIVTSQLPSYLGFKILNYKPDYAEQIDVTYRRQVWQQDFTLGTIRQVTTDAAPQNLERVEYLADTRDKIRDLFVLLNTLRGRWKPFWRLARGDDDLILAVAVTAGATTAQFSAPDYNRFYNLIASRKDVAVNDMTGTTLKALRITGCTSVGNGNLQLTFDSTIPVSIPVGISRYHFSFLRFARLATDAIEVEWLRHDCASFSLLIEDLQYGEGSYT